MNCDICAREFTENQMLIKRDQIKNITHCICKDQCIYFYKICNTCDQCLELKWFEDKKDDCRNCWLKTLQTYSSLIDALKLTNSIPQNFGQ